MNISSSLRSKNVTQAIAQLNAHPWIVAHRGDWRVLPENSIEAAQRAFALGADMVEIDAQCIADGTLAVIHDETLGRTTNLTGQVRDLTPEAMKGAKLRASDGLGAAEMTDISLPRLDDMLDALRGQGMINVDTKNPAELDAACAVVLDLGMADQVLMKMIVPAGADGSEFLTRPWFGKLPFMPVVLDAPKGALVDVISRIAQRTRSPLVEIQFRDLDELRALAGVLHPQGVGIWTNTLDPVHSLDLSDSRALDDAAGVWGLLRDCGVGALQTDQAQALAKFWGR